MGIAYFIARRSIKIFFSNSHPTSIPTPDSRFPIPDSRFPIPDSRFPIPLFKRKTPIAGVSLTESNLSKKSHQGKHRANTQPCQVTEDPEVARVSRKFITANRPPSNEKKDF
ncbi:MAG: hypothetical protein F6K50_29740 [Moorea sp. SIO3I7]|nr:hypothetical protein [Moorena sp. SIO3I7]